MQFQLSFGGTEGIDRGLIICRVPNARGIGSIPTIQNEVRRVLCGGKFR